MIQKVKIAYFSGTGGTARAAGCFAAAFSEKGCIVDIRAIRGDIAADCTETDLLVLLFAVHACNAPAAVYRWLDSLPVAAGTMAAVIAVSGGGEVSPNTACRDSTIRRLEKKGYAVFYEDMLVMPSNWMIATKEQLSLRLLEVLPAKAGAIANRLLAGEKKRIVPLLADRLISRLGEMEKFGARVFGRRIKRSAACNGCGWCAGHCPAGNIVMADGWPVFGRQCNMCLSCLYGCPKQALSPGLIRFVLIKAGFSLAALEQKLPCQEPMDIKQLARGYLWSGVRKYLK
jgi:ferredoxin